MQTRAQLNKNTVPVLTGMAKEMGIAVPARIKKADLIGLILRRQEEEKKLKASQVVEQVEEVPSAEAKDEDKEEEMAPAAEPQAEEAAKTVASPEEPEKSEKPATQVEEVKKEKEEIITEPMVPEKIYNELQKEYERYKVATEESLRGKDQEITSLKEEISKIEDNNKQLQNSVDELQKKIESMITKQEHEEALAAVKKENDDAVNEMLEKYENEIAELKTELETAKKNAQVQAQVKVEVSSDIRTEQDTNSTKRKAKIVKKSKAKSIKRPSGKKRSMVSTARPETQINEQDNSSMEISDALGSNDPTEHDDRGEEEEEEEEKSQSSIREDIEEHKATVSKPENAIIGAKLNKDDLSTSNKVEIKPIERSGVHAEPHQPVIHKQGLKLPTQININKTPIVYNSPALRASKLSASYGKSSKSNSSLRLASSISRAAENAAVMKKPSQHPRDYNHFFLHYKKLGLTDRFYQKFVIQQHFKDVYIDNGQLNTNMDFTNPGIIYLLDEERGNSMLIKGMNDLKAIYSQTSLVFFRYITREDLITWNPSISKIKHIHEYNNGR